jgi:hypothetical protein
MTERRGSPVGRVANRVEGEERVTHTALAGHPRAHCTGERERERERERVGHATGRH